MDPNKIWFSKTTKPNEGLSRYVSPKEQIQQDVNPNIIVAQGGAKFPFPKVNTYNNWRASLPKRLQHEGDYDLRGMYDEEGWVPVDQADQHFTDRHKKPNHPTFSNESKYHNVFTPGGKWTKENKEWRFNPSHFNIKMIGGKDRLQEYFKHNDPGVKLGSMNVYPFK